MTSLTVQEIQKELASLTDAEAAAVAQRFFKTGPGEYGEGDLFRGIRVPIIRHLARRLADRHQTLTLAETRLLLRSSFHEDRLLALFILVRLYSRGDEALKEQIFQLYLQNTKFINGWDLVDTSAPNIVGAYLWNKDRAVLSNLSQSRSFWERRIAIMATFYFIKHGEYSDTLKIARILLADSEDLIHKAVGWMLREVGNKDREVEESFLRAHHQKMPRTML